ncbi:MAG: permease [Myxococcales bacterium]|nr:permease [Myxococcales bacterium]
MLLPLAIAIGSVVLGAALGLGGRRGSVSAISTFAMIAALAVVVTHLLPDALADLGLWALLIFAVSLLIPSLLENAAAKLGAKHSNRWGLELGYAALLVHKLGDGLALGTYSTGAHAGHSHLDVFVAIAAHDVPVIALVAMAYHASGGVKAAILRTGGLASATIVGVFLPGLIDPEIYADYEPWVAAAVAGLLLHVVAHDWSPELKVPKSARARLVDLLAVAAGIGLVLLGGEEGHGHGHEGLDVRSEMATALLELAIETAPALLLGLGIGAVLTALGSKLPTRWLRSGSPLGQALRGAVVGAPLPICACGVLPLASSLRQRGAGAALVVAFLIATPELGVETFALTASFVGWPFALVRLTAAVFLAVVAALVVHRATRSSRGEDVDGEAIRGEVEGSFFARTVEAFDELLYHVAPWTVVGLIAAAYVQAVLTPDELGAMRAGGLDVLVVTAVAVPSYVCAASATPLAAVMLTKGMSPGAVLVGLLLGPATNLATIGFLRKTFGGRATLVGVAAVVLASWGMAAVVNAVDIPITLDAAGDEVHGHGWPTLVMAGLLALALLRSIWRTGLRAWLASIGEGLGAGHHHHHHHGHGHDGHAHGHEGHGHGHEGHEGHGHGHEGHGHEGHGHEGSH